MLKMKWNRICLDHRHNIARGERIKYLIYEGDSENNNQLICDNCGKHKSWKAITEQNTVWCIDCLPTYDEVYRWTNKISKRNNNNEKIKQALWKDFVRQYTREKKTF